MASSDELEGDRAVFGNLDASYGSIRKQEEYNEKVRESDRANA